MVFELSPHPRQIISFCTFLYMHSTYTYGIGANSQQLTCLGDKTRRGEGGVSLTIIGDDTPLNLQFQLHHLHNDVIVNTHSNSQVKIIFCMLQFGISVNVSPLW